MSRKQLQFRGQLYPFQQDVVDWSGVIDQGIIGLEMGLGKTVVMLSILCLKNYGRIIIVLPLQIVEQWKNSILKFTNLTERNIAIYQGPRRKFLKLQNHRVVLTTYDVVRRDMLNKESVLYNTRNLFDCIVLDEAHKIRNRKTISYSTCADLASKIEAKWLLTGTTIHNKFSDFFTLCQFLNVPETTMTTFADDKKAIAWKKMRYYRLTKTQCGLDLPEKSVTEHFLKFDDTHAEEYQSLCDEIKELYNDYMAHPMQLQFTSLLTKILRLRQCCNHMDAHLSEEQYRLKKNRHDGVSSVKFDKIIEIIEQTPKNEKILIFSQWTHSLHLLTKQLNRFSIQYLTYDGSMEIGEKNRTLQEFRDGNDKVLLLTMTSGGVGLDLSFANHVILMDSWWNLALEEQAINRVYRIGQTRKVEVHRLYISESIEHWMIVMKIEKQAVSVKSDEEHSIYLVNQMLLGQILHQYV